MSFFKKPILGVDIGSRTIKGVQLKKNRNGKVSLTGHFFQDLALISKGQQMKGNSQETLKAALETSSLQSHHAATTVKDSEVLSFNLDLPNMTEKELEQVVPQEVAEQGQLNMEEHSCDFVVHPNGVKAHCVKKATVLAQMKVLENAGLKPVAIESEMMAITSMLDFNDYLKHNEVAVVFDLGESHVSSALVVDGVLTLTRSTRTSFGQTSLKLQAEGKLSYKDAERMKQEYDFFVGPGSEKNNLTEILDDAYTEVFKAIKLDIEFYQEYFSGARSIDRALLVGGGSQIKSAIKVIEKFLKVEAIVVNPFRNIDIFSKNEATEEVATLAPYMGTAVGLALNSIEWRKTA